MVAAEARLSGEGIETTGVDDTVCCYAEKTETWVHGPDGTRWEWYVKHGDAEQIQNVVIGTRPGRAAELLPELTRDDGDVAVATAGPAAGLAITETVSWGICYYGFAVLIPPMERDLGWSRATLVGAFTIAVIVSGFAAFPVGRWLDRGSARAADDDRVGAGHPRRARLVAVPTRRWRSTGRGC